MLWNRQPHLCYGKTMLSNAGNNSKPFLVTSDLKRSSGLWLNDQYPHCMHNYGSTHMTSTDTQKKAPLALSSSYSPPPQKGWQLQPMWKTWPLLKCFQGCQKRREGLWGSGLQNTASPTIGFLNSSTRQRAFSWTRSSMLLFPILKFHRVMREKRQVSFHLLPLLKRIQKLLTGGRP